MRLTEIVEVIALSVFVFGIFVLVGLGGGCIAASLALLVIAYSLEGVSIYPHRRIVTFVSWIRSKVKRGHE